MITIRELVSHVGEQISVLGFVETLRAGKRRAFLDIGYGPDRVQSVASTADLPADLTVRSYVRVDGTVRTLPPDKYSHLPVELTDSRVILLSRADDTTLSKCPAGASTEVQLRERHHYFRDPTFASILRLSDALAQSVRQFFRDTHCTELIPPSFTGVECEGGATLFSLEHPGKSVAEPQTVYLTQSSQFALEMALPGLGDCFCIAPSFRKEHSHTRRHLTEFTHVESEWGGILTFEDHLDKLRALLQGTLRHFLVLGASDLRALGQYDRVVTLLAKCQDIVVLEHQEAIQQLNALGIRKKDGSVFGPEDDIEEAEERKLIDTLDRVVFLTKFPKVFKSFYMCEDPSDPSRVLGCDVEVPGVGEIIGSGVREFDAARLTQRLLENHLKPEDYTEYIELRRCGFARTSGMGLGLGRMLTWLLDLHSIRQVVAFPRFPGYVRP